MKEMSEGVPVLDAEAAKPDVESTDDNNEFKAINPPITRDKKKDLKTKRKAREEKQKQTTRMLAKIEKQKITDLYRLVSVYHPCLYLILLGIRKTNPYPFLFQSETNFKRSDRGRRKIKCAYQEAQRSPGS